MNGGDESTTWHTPRNNREVCPFHLAVASHIATIAWHRTWGDPAICVHPWRLTDPELYEGARADKESSDCLGLGVLDTAMNLLPS